MKCIFVFAYYSFKDPVFQSAVLPYLKLVAPRGVKFVLLTWEQEKFFMDVAERSEIKDRLLALNIVWYYTRWHSGRLKLVKKGFDLVKGIVFSLRLINKHNATKIYSEGFPGAVITHILSWLTRIPHIVHTFEPHADYMLESKVWKATSWEFRLLKSVEILIARNAQFIITPTHAYKKVLMEKSSRENVIVIPSCVDTGHYKFLPAKRTAVRERLNIRPDQIVIVYLGKLGGMYMDNEIFQFFRQCLRSSEDRFFFFLFTVEHAALINCLLDRFEIPRSKVFAKFLTKEEVPEYLSAADVGFCGIRPIPSRRYSSPIKNGEYWSCGLPVLVPIGISDDYRIAREKGIGYAFSNLNEIDMTLLDSLKLVDRNVIQRIGSSLRGLATYKEVLFRLFTGD